MADNKWAKRIQGLLRQAEGTTNEAEAATFLAKAQELMAKYAVDEEMLSRLDEGRRARPVSEKIEEERNTPGVKAKRALLNQLCQMNRCQSWMMVPGRTTYIAGFESDVHFVRMLYSSILIQMEAALQRALAGDTRGVTASSYRTNFMYGYVERIVERLKEQNREMSSSTALVLRDRTAEVEKYVEETKGKIRSGPPRKYTADAEAQADGYLAANGADVSGGRNNLGQRKDALGSGG